MTPSTFFYKNIIYFFLMIECSSSHEYEVLTQLTVPLIKATDDKRFYLGVYFKATWWKAHQYCLQHGMTLATVDSKEENDKLERVIRHLGHNDEYFFTSGTDNGQEGKFYWIINGRSVAYTNWAGPEEPSDLKLHTSDENCLALFYQRKKGLMWADLPCNYEKYFICEIHSASRSCDGTVLDNMGEPLFTKSF